VASAAFVALRTLRVCVRACLVRVMMGRQVPRLLRNVAGEVSEQDERHHSAPLAGDVQP